VKDLTGRGAPVQGASSARHVPSAGEDTFEHPVGPTSPDAAMSEKSPTHVLSLRRILIGRAKPRRGLCSLSGGRPHPAALWRPSIGRDGVSMPGAWSRCHYSQLGSENSEWEENIELERQNSELVRKAPF